MSNDKAAELVARVIGGDPDNTADILIEFLKTLDGNATSIDVIATIGSAFVVMSNLYHRAAFAGAVTTIRMLMLKNPHAPIEDILKASQRLLESAAIGEQETVVAIFRQR
jgi:hypothetical protein